MTHTTLKQWPILSWRRNAVSSKTIGWIALAVTILSASTYNTFAKILTGTLTPLSLLFVSELLTGLFAVVSFGVMPLLRDISRIKRRSILPIMFIGVTNGVIGPLLLFEGLKRSTAVNASLFTNMEMVFLVMLAILILRESFHREHVLSALAITAGMLTISLRGFTEGIHLYAGDMLFVLSGLSFAVGSLVFRKYLRHAKSHVVLFVRAMVAVMLFFIFSALVGHPLADDIRAFPLSVIPVLIGFGFISRFLKVFSFYEALDHLPVTTVSLMNNMGIITSIGFAWWVLREPIEGYHIVGGVLIVLGTILLEVAGTHRTPKQLQAHHRTRK